MNRHTVYVRFYKISFINVGLHTILNNQGCFWLPIMLASMALPHVVKLTQMFCLI